MGKHYTILLLVAGFCLMLSPFMFGCSDKESSESQKPKKVVIRIERQTPKKMVEQAPAERKLKEQSALQAEGAQEAMVEPKKGQEKKPQTAESQQEKAEFEDQVGEGQKPGVSPEKKEFESCEFNKYVTHAGDTLFSISGSPEVFSDPFKWPCLLKFNMETLQALKLKPGFENVELPPGLELRVPTPEQVQRSTQNRGKARWAVNIFSDKSSKRISRLAIKLVENGIPVYITRANIKGEIWLRLRTGFFESKDKAREVQERVKEITGLDGVWITRVSNSEFNKFAGYL